MNHPYKIDSTYNIKIKCGNTGCLEFEKESGPARLVSVVGADGVSLVCSGGDSIGQGVA